MRTVCKLLFVSFFALAANQCTAQTDIFWSLQNLGEGAVNQELEINAEVGDVVSLFAYWDTLNSEVDIGIKFLINTSAPGVINFVGGETFDFNIALFENTDIILGARWGDAFGPIGIDEDAQGASLTAFSVTGGDGIIDFNTGPIFLDLGYDVDADAFLYARVDVELVGPGRVQFLQESRNNGSGIANNGMAVDATFGAVTIFAKDKGVMLGDLNGDGFVTLLDVAIFVDLLVNQGFQLEADMNQDGSVDLLDVDLFIAAIDFP